MKFLYFILDFEKIIVYNITTQDVVDITDLEALRQQYKADVEARGGKLTLTVFVLKALVNALKEFPKFNASLGVEAVEIVLTSGQRRGGSAAVP